MTRAMIWPPLEPHGLILRGGFGFARGRSGPARPIGRTGADPCCWSARRALRRGRISCAGGSGSPPIHRRSARQLVARRSIGAVAATFGARAVSPSDRPYLPFQQWAMRAEGLKPSPLGILMHPRYGLWHAYRGALLFDAEIAVEAPRDGDSPLRPMRLENLA